MTVGLIGPSRQVTVRPRKSAVATGVRVRQENSSPTERLIALMDHLGLPAAYFGTPIPRDLSGMAAEHPERIAGVVLCVPDRLDPAPFAGIADRVLMIAGERGPAAEATARAANRLPAARRSVLSRYEAPGSWSDAVADRTDEIAERVIAFFDELCAGGRPAGTPRRVPAQGNHAGISYRIDGAGPALILLPFFLAPSQWTPAIPRLARHFTVVTTGGPHLGGVASLEDRAQMASYRAMFRNLIDVMGRGRAKRFSKSAAAPVRWSACWRSGSAAATRSPRPTSTRFCCAKPRN
jgi:hypothetical protein